MEPYITFTWEKFLNEGLDTYFNARMALSDGTEVPIRPSSLWRLLESRPPFKGELRLPAGLRAVAIYSKGAFNFMRALCVLPDTSVYSSGKRLLGSREGETRVRFWLGFEDGASGNIAAFTLHSDEEVSNQLRAVIGRSGYWQENVIDIFKPKDFAEARHAYSVIIRRNLVLFEVDNVIRHITLLTPIEAKIKENVQPYTISAFPFMLKENTFLLEMIAFPFSMKDRTAEVSPYNVRLGRTSSEWPLALPLFIEDKEDKFTGYSVNKDKLVSHPVPTYGFSRSSIYFMADKGGKLDIEVFTLSGNWRSYDSINVSPDKLVKYTIGDNIILTRIIYSPSSYPARILEGEALMN